MLVNSASSPKSYENHSRPGVFNLGVWWGFHEPLEIVYRLLGEGFFHVLKESCDLKIPTDPERLSVALKDVASGRLA